MIKSAALFLIKFYQITISPDHGFLKIKPLTCRFYPTCSQYTYQAIDKYGFLKGGWLGFKRILKCHPLHPGGVDLLK